MNIIFDILLYDILRFFCKSGHGLISQRRTPTACRCACASTGTQTAAMSKWRSTARDSRRPCKQRCRSPRSFSYVGMECSSQCTSKRSPKSRCRPTRPQCCSGARRRSSTRGSTRPRSPNALRQRGGADFGKSIVFNSLLPDSKIDVQAAVLELQGAFAHQREEETHKCHVPGLAAARGGRDLPPRGSWRSREHGTFSSTRGDRVGRGSCRLGRREAKQALPSGLATTVWLARGRQSSILWFQGESCSRRCRT